MLFRSSFTKNCFFLIILTNAIWVCLYYRYPRSGVCFLMSKMWVYFISTKFYQCSLIDSHSRQRLGSGTPLCHNVSCAACVYMYVYMYTFLFVCVIYINFCEAFDFHLLRLIGYALAERCHENFFTLIFCFFARFIFNLY